MVVWPLSRVVRGAEITGDTVVSPAFLVPDGVPADGDMIGAGGHQRDTIIGTHVVPRNRQ